MGTMSILLMAALIQDPYAIPYDKIPEDFRERVKNIREDPTLDVTIDRTEVKSTAETYDFLLEELPFTAALVRALGKGKYDIWTEADVAKAPAKDDAERDRRRHTYYLDDKDGMKLKATLVFKESNRWIYYTYGHYLSFTGRSVIVVTCEKNGDVLSTEAKVFTDVEGTLASLGAEIFGDAVEDAVRDKAKVFIDAARTVCEAAKTDPESLVRIGKSAKDVDAKILEKFKSNFLKP